MKRIILASLATLSIGVLAACSDGEEEKKEQVKTDNELVLEVIDEMEVVKESGDTHRYSEFASADSPYIEALTSGEGLIDGVGNVDTDVKVDIEYENVSIVHIDDDNGYVALNEVISTSEDNEEPISELPFLYGLEKVGGDWKIYDVAPSMFIEDMDMAINVMEEKRNGTKE